jgi:hypothetical protein
MLININVHINLSSKDFIITDNNKADRVLKALHSQESSTKTNHRLILY